MRDNNYKKSKKSTFKESRGGESSTVVVSDNNKSGPSDAVIGKHLEVVVYNNAFDKALRAFRALVQKERILSSYKEKQRYEKPSDKKRRKRNEMKRKLMEMNIVKDNYKNYKKKSKKVENSDSE